MSLNVNVQGGTGGGKKKPFHSGPPEDWFCRCPNPFLNTTIPNPGNLKLNRGWLAVCPDCGMERP